MNILVTGAWRAQPYMLEKIVALGHEVTIMPDERGELPCDPQKIDGVICNGLFLYHDIDIFQNLKYIQLTSAGYDRVPMDIIKNRGITVNNARGVYSIPMSEYALCGVLQLYKRSDIFRRNQDRKIWEKQRNISELYGKTVVIIGAGSVGSECAKRFSAFGCKTVGIDLFPQENNCFDTVLPLGELDEALSQADIVVLTLPLTDESRGIMGKEAFLRVKDGAVLVNISRGAVVDTEEMISALNSKKLSGAVLDVFDEEPLNCDSPLWSMENVIITPHNSFVGEGNAERLFDLVYENIKKEKVK